MIERSAELEAIAQRWLSAYSKGDGEALANMVSRDDAAIYLGTDPDEVWSGADIVRVLPHHIAEIGERLSPEIVFSTISAYELGSAGWASVTGVVRSAGGEFPVRSTLIFALESGVWRVVLCHNAVAVPNPDVVGVELTQGIAALLGEIDDAAESTIREAVTEGTVALMFTDMVDSSAWLTKLGDTEWARIVQWHDAAVRAIVAERGGSVVKTLGDGAMAVFDSARGAARAARGIQGAVSGADELPDIAVRIGLHVGEVVQTGDDYLGQAVHKAARIASIARGGEIQVSTSVAALLEDNPEFELGPPVETVLRGLEGTHRIMRLDWGGD